MTGLPDTEHVYEFGPFRLDVVRLRLWRDGDLVALTPRSFDTLVALVRHAGRVVEKEELMRLVWPDTNVVDDNLTQQISSLRKALGDQPDAPTYILTIPRRGYRFLADVRAISHDMRDTPPPQRPSLQVEPLPIQAEGMAPVAIRHDESERERLPPEVRVPRAGGWARSVWAIGGVLLALLLGTGAAVGIARWPVEGAPHAVRFLISPPSDVTLRSGGVLSPDGRWLVYVGADSSGQSMLMLRALDDVDAKPLAGTAGASAPFWSPDSRYVGFFGSADLKKVNVHGPPEVVTLVASFPSRGGGRGGGTWSQDGIIVYAPSRVTELYSVSSNGGTPRAVTTLAGLGRETGHQWPQFLPDGRHFLYTALGRRPDDAGIYLASLDSPSRTLLLKSTGRAVFAPPGHLLFMRDGSLVAQRFDVSAARLEGVPRTVAVLPNQDDVSISASRQEALTYAGVNSPVRQLAWYDRSGRLVSQVTSQRLFAPALSPDEQRIAVEHQGEIWLVEPGGQTSRFMLGPDTVTSPVWSPDGRRIAVASTNSIYLKAANDATRAELLAADFPDPPVLYDWSSDGRFILYTARSPATQWDLWLLPTTGSHQPMPFLRSEFTEYQARLSPSGCCIAYVSDESGTLEIYVESFPTPGHKVRVSTTGGAHPTWRADGKELFYLTPDKKLVAVSVTTRPTLAVGTPHVLFQTRVTGAARNHYVVSGDGQRFLIGSPNSEPLISPITVVLNWQALLQGDSAN